MQKKLLPVMLVAVLSAGAARAQDTTVVTPTTPAPAVETPASAAPVAAAPVQAPAATTVTQAAPGAVVAPAPNQVIYSPRLPTATELANVAAAQGQTIEHINQTATQVTVIYRNANGAASTVAYQLLPNAGSPATSAPVVVPAPAPTVIYQQTPQVIYYDTYDYYRPRYYSRPPVSLHFGFGYSHFHHHGRPHHRRHW